MTMATTSRRKSVSRSPERRDGSDFFEVEGTQNARSYQEPFRVQPPLVPLKPTRSHLTRNLHLATLLIVLHQLFGSLIVERPLPGEDPDWPYWMHEYVGIAGAAVLTLFWAWTLVRHSNETPLGQLFPWFSMRRLKDIIHEIHDAVLEARTGRAGDFEIERAASAFHGLGLLTVTFVAFSGAAWYFLLRGTPYGREALGLHRLVANLMWFYVVAHASAGLLHNWLGHDLFARMFWFRRREA